ncbi:hypothetical protein [Kitasatospora sp. NBC_00240]|uniref:hypothetical protein n=1 Tax=Kitasatospora sp. NBC_00240 TaxID=2903567 RepID=UPI002254D364|nr:hypothetical protein [Kitasatospora sp. NBC_00240]
MGAPGGLAGRRAAGARGLAVGTAWCGRPPAPETHTSQRERLAELRAVRDAAVVAVRRHPTMVRALAEGCWAATDVALFHATEPTPEPADAG